MTVSSGIAMEIHYCMGKQAGVDFYKTKGTYLLGSSKWEMASREVLT